MTTPCISGHSPGHLRNGAVKTPLASASSRTYAHFGTPFAIVRRGLTPHITQSARVLDDMHKGSVNLPSWIPSRSLRLFETWIGGRSPNSTQGAHGGLGAPGSSNQPEGDLSSTLLRVSRFWCGTRLPMRYTTAPCKASPQGAGLVFEVAQRALQERVVTLLRLTLRGPSTTSPKSRRCVNSTGTYCLTHSGLDVVSGCA